MLQNQIDEAKRGLEYYHYECEKNKNELARTGQEIIKKKNFIQNLDTEEGYIRIKESAKNQAEYIMRNNRHLLDYAVTTTFEAIRRYPAIQDLFFQLLTVGSNPFYQQSCIESHRNGIVELAEYIQMEIKQGVTNDVIIKLQNANS